MIRKISDHMEEQNYESFNKSLDELRFTTKAGWQPAVFSVSIMNPHPHVYIYIDIWRIGLYSIYILSVMQYLVDIW